MFQRIGKKTRRLRDWSDGNSTRVTESYPHEWRYGSRTVLCRWYSSDNDYTWWAVLGLGQCHCQLVFLLPAPPDSVSSLRGNKRDSQWQFIERDVGSSYLPTNGELLGLSHILDSYNVDSGWFDSAYFTVGSSNFRLTATNIASIILIGCGS